ncbi:dihydrofolate reductase [Tissierella sp.]|uniref:dihydrofolate reductase n=1 Tax=Tissierella sp. TaxID=41274 RepID=UPI0028598D2B|nr:dihydrofolate reductase [Tissierella sp.]MDR7857793.1 dihydrofolate reductase [Tissierella sp.]
MKAIVAVDLNWGIGFDGKLLEVIPDDMKFFRQKTIGNVVVMGRETFESLPEKKPLKNRVNLILTREKFIDNTELTVCNSVEDTLMKLKKYDSNNIFIIGGESIYNQFLPYCDEIFITKIYKEYKANKFLPNIDKDKNWILKEKSEIKKYKHINYNFNTYIKL